MLGAGEEVHQQQASINQQEAALQKLVDLQAADEIVTTRYVPWITARWGCFGTQICGLSGMRQTCLIAMSGPLLTKSGAHGDSELKTVWLQDGSCKC